MDYYINPAVFTSVFTVPCIVTDRYLKLAKGEHIKVLLYILRNMSAQWTVQSVSKETGVSEYDVKEALLYWADAGILLPVSKQSPVKTEPKPPAVSRTEKPSRIDVAKRGIEDPKVRYLLQETEIKFGRILKENEASTLVWLYDDQGLDVSLIMLIVAFAVEKNKANIRFIESTAIDWINKGIDNITDADNELRKINMSEQAFNVVCSAFGMERRKPSKKELELSLKWIDEYKFSKEMLVCAYEECVNKKSKFSLPYTAKILDNWYNQGIKTPEDILNASAKNNKDIAAYNLDLYEKMLNSKD